MPPDAYPDKAVHPAEQEQVQTGVPRRSTVRTDPDIGAEPRELVAVLKAQVADLDGRLDAAEVDRRAERADWQEERRRLLDMLAAREVPPADAGRVAAAEGRAAEAERLLAGALAELRGKVAALQAPRPRARPRWRFW